MKIEIEVDEKYLDTSIFITAPKMTDDIEKLISFMRSVDSKLAVKNQDETVLLDTSQILYIETLERNSFVYTKDSTFQSDLRLYELERQLSNQDFIRVSKQFIINLKKVKSLKADINRKIRVTLQNGEQIIVSRMYADELRKRLGVK